MNGGDVVGLGTVGRIAFSILSGSWDIICERK